MNILLVAIGGFFGSIFRYHISLKTNKHVIGTWIANISGSLLLGVILRFHMTNQLSDWAWMLLGVGFCGAFTTFSTFGNETLELIFHKEYKRALLYIFSSLVISFVLVYISLVGIF